MTHEQGDDLQSDTSSSCPPLFIEMRKALSDFETGPYGTAPPKVSQIEVNPKVSGPRAGADGGGERASCGGGEREGLTRTEGRWEGRRRRL